MSSLQAAHGGAPKARYGGGQPPDKQELETAKPTLPAQPEPRAAGKFFGSSLQAAHGGAPKARYGGGQPPDKQELETAKPTLPAQPEPRAAGKFFGILDASGAWQTWRTDRHLGMLRRPRPILLVLFCLAPVWCGEAPTAVPDPYGLGERLALIDWLKSNRCAIGDPQDLDGLRRRYREATAPSAPTGAARRRDEEYDRLARDLWVRFSKPTQADWTHDDLRRAIADAEATQAARDAEQQAWAQRREAELARKDATDPPRPSRPARPKPSHWSVSDQDQAPAPEETGTRESVQIAALDRTIKVIPLPAPVRAGSEATALVAGREDEPILVISLAGREYAESVAKLLLATATERKRVGVQRAVALIGHSDGQFLAAFTGDSDTRSIAGHLRHHREWYATFGGTKRAAAIDLFILMGCNPQGHNQEMEIRQGLDYLPNRRVFTPEGALTNGVVALPAILHLLRPASDVRKRALFKTDQLVNGKPVECLSVIGGYDLAGGDLERWLVQPGRKPVRIER